MGITTRGACTSLRLRMEDSHANEENDMAREQERFLPIANITRIMKKALPANAKVAKDAKETVQECVSEFISFITSDASDKCQREKRKTINGDDLFGYEHSWLRRLHRTTETVLEKISRVRGRTIASVGPCVYL